MINEASIRCFLTLARTLSFTETARQTYMTQQSVSKYIARLEEDIGFPLFIRTHHQVSLTKAGENYYQLFSKLSTDYEAVKKQTGRYYAERAAKLRLGYPEHLDFSPELEEAGRLLPELHVKAEKYPQYELNERFLSRELDLILTFPEFAPAGSNLASSELMQTPLLLLVSPEHPLAVPDAVPEDFKNEPFIRAACREPLSDARACARRQCRKLGFTPSELVISPNPETAFLTAQFGRGVLVSPRLVFDAVRPKLKCYELGRTEPLLCLRHKASEHPAAEEFAEALVHAFSKLHP